MEIDEIRKIDNYIKLLDKVNTKGKPADKPKSKDNVEISPEAKEKIKLLKLLSGKSPEIIEKKIQEVKKRISKGYYDKENVQKEAIDNLLKFLLP